MSADQCPNPGPTQLKDSSGRPLYYAVCPACGGNFAILASGRFRRHKPIYQPGSPRIAENLASFADRADGSTAPIKHL